MIRVEAIQNSSQYTSIITYSKQGQAREFHGITSAIQEARNQQTFLWAMGCAVHEEWKDNRECFRMGVGSSSKVSDSLCSCTGCAMKKTIDEVIVGSSEA